MSLGKVVLGFVVLSLCASFINSCTFDANDERGHCASFAALQDAGVHSEWKKLDVINYGNQSFKSIEKGAFSGVYNVVDLQVKGLANNMEEGAWDGLTNLYELHLDDNKFHVIRSRAFADLPIDTLFIYNCEVREMQPRALDRMPKLKQVFMTNNYMSTIEAGVFSNTQVSYINLNKNRIQHVAPNAFSEMEDLRQLVLSDNLLTSFEPQQAIGHAPNLWLLFLSRNKLTKVTRDMFIPMPKLEILLLNINQIERIGDRAFVDLPILKTLDVSNNRLEELKKDVFKVTGMQKFEFLFIHDNKLSFLSSGTLVRLPNLKWMSVGGNPWQCPCWDVLNDYMVHKNVTRLCYEEYTQGNRPFCVFSELHPRDCIYDVENVRDVPQIYIDTLKEYPALPLYCKADGVSTPALIDARK